MILIGERINGMFKDVKEAIASKDKKVIQNLALRQTAAGASYLDVNVGTVAANGLILNSPPLNKKSDEAVFDKYVQMAQSAGPKANLIA